MRAMLPGKQGVRGSSGSLHAFRRVISRATKAVFDDRSNVRFCNGPLCQAAPVYPVAGYLLLSVVSLSCHIIRSEEAVSPSFQRSL
jgi:hypothetical protein